MISKNLRRFLLVVLLLAGGAVATFLHLENTRLRKRIAERRVAVAAIERLQAVNRENERLLTEMTVSGDNREAALQAALTRARAQINELEQRARDAHQGQRAQAQKDAAFLVGNRDPEKGLMQLEYFENSGQATPARAFQTLVWAALKGENDELAGLFAFEAGARERAEAAIAALPELSRGPYSSPEAQAALFFAAAVNGRSAAGLSGVEFQDPRHATLTVVGLADRPQQLRMQLDAEGWRVTVSVDMADKLGAWAMKRSVPPGN